MMKTGNDVLTDFTGFVSLHCDKALNARGLHTYACIDGRFKRLHMFTSASSFKSIQYITWCKGHRANKPQTLSRHAVTPQHKVIAARQPIRPTSPSIALLTALSNNFPGRSLRMHSNVLVVDLGEIARAGQDHCSAVQPASPHRVGSATHQNLDLDLRSCVGPQAKYHSSQTSHIGAS